MAMLRRVLSLLPRDLPPIAFQAYQRGPNGEKVLVDDGEAYAYAALIHGVAQVCMYEGMYVGGYYLCLRLYIHTYIRTRSVWRRRQG